MGMIRRSRKDENVGKGRERIPGLLNYGRIYAPVKRPVHSI